MCSKQTARRFSLASLALLLAVLLGAAPAWQTRIAEAPNRDEFLAALAGIPSEVADEFAVRNLISDARRDAPGWQDRRAALVRALETRGEFARTAPGGRVADPADAARRILANPLYRDPGVGDEENWLARAIERVTDWIWRLLDRFRIPEREVGLPGAPVVSLGFLQPIVWALLAAGLGFLVFLAARHFKLGPRKRRVGGLLEGDEPERTADEWLVRAAELEAEGRFREAVRCLYLACLMRFDDASVARFVRSETNWEHLGRIMASTKRPPALDFTATTQSFDRVWYGHQVEGPPDVARFRDAYTTVVRELAARSAA